MALPPQLVTPVTPPGGMPDAAAVREFSRLKESRVVREKLFAGIGVLLILSSLFFSFFELDYAVHGSPGAWMVLSALLCAGVLGVGMVRVGRGVDQEN